MGYDPRVNKIVRQVEILEMEIGRLSKENIKIKKGIEEEMAMNDLEKLKEVLDHQEYRTMTALNYWPRLDYTTSQFHQEEGDGPRLIIFPLSIGFAFSEEGRLIGAFNYKQ